MEQEFALLMR